MAPPRDNGSPTLLAAPTPPPIYRRIYQSTMAAITPAPAPTTTDRLATTVLNPSAGGQPLNRVDSLDVDSKERATHNEDERNAYNDPKYVDDDSAGPVDRFGGVTQVSEAEAKLRKKLDYRIISILWAMYFLN